ncbi:MAG: DNA replication/repair protein RecF [Desulfuromonadia bacterium]
MHLERISVHSFRNLASQTIEFDNRLNLFCGENGQGKTNILEAIYILGNLKSFRTIRNGDLIRYDSPSGFVAGSIIRGEFRDELSVEVTPSCKRPMLNGNNPEQISQYLSLMPIVIFSPEDGKIIRGEPEYRRRFLDRCIFSIDPLYLTELQRYNKVLTHRNNLLRMGDTSSLETWDHELARWGSVIVSKRKRQATLLYPLAAEHYRLLSGTGHHLSVTYLSTIGKEQMNGEEEIARSFMDRLVTRRKEEMIRKTTLTGPHRDDLMVMIDGREARKFASQGEQRTAALTLKMAELTLVEDSRGYPPILLLDDLASEIDEVRLERIMAHLAGKRGQMFITTTDAGSVTTRYHKGVALFSVSQGTIRQRFLLTARNRGIPLEHR